MRFAAAWTGQGFIDWNGINFNGSHQVHPRLVGKIELANPNEPAGPTRRQAPSMTCESAAGTAALMVRCPAGWSTTGGFTGMETG